MMTLVKLRGSHRLMGRRNSMQEAGFLCPDAGGAGSHRQTEFKPMLSILQSIC